MKGTFIFIGDLVPVKIVRQYFFRLRTYTLAFLRQDHRRTFLKLFPYVIFR